MQVISFSCGNDPVLYVMSKREMQSAFAVFCDRPATVSSDPTGLLNHHHRGDRRSAARCHNEIHDADCNR
jgi:hypothetical protein